jgi:hypothetical protein
LGKGHQGGLQPFFFRFPDHGGIFLVIARARFFSVLSDISSSRFFLKAIYSRSYTDWAWDLSSNAHYSIMRIELGTT